MISRIPHARHGAVLASALALAAIASCLMGFSGKAHAQLSSWSPAWSDVLTSPRHGSDDDGNFSVSAGYVEPESFASFFDGRPSSRIRLSLNPRLGDSTLHLSLQGDPDNGHRQAGFGRGRFALSFVNGQGEGLSLSRGSGHTLQSNFFHGAVTRPFSYSGLSTSYAWAPDIHQHAGTVTITSSETDDRTVHYTGISTPSFRGGAYAVERGPDSVGLGSYLGWRTGPWEIEAQELRSETSARWRQVGFAFNDDRGGTLRTSFGMGRNRLYEEAEDSRFMLTYRVPLGGGKAQAKVSARNLHGGSTGTAGAFDGAFDFTIVAVGSGLVVTSGQETLDEWPRFPQQHQAAYSQLYVYNPISVRENREYGGAVYRNPDGTYSPAQYVVPGMAHSVTYNPHWLVPSWTRATAAWHTHGAYDPNYVGEMFSPTDIRASQNLQVDAYLGTPLGRMLYYELRTNLIYKLFFESDPTNEFILPH